MTVSIMEILATLPSGQKGPPLTIEEVGQYVRNQCNRPEDIERERRHALRDEFYLDGGTQAMNRLIDEVFQDESVRAMRKKLVPVARYNNAIRRIVGEKSMVYAEPARRSVTGVEDNKRYQQLLDDIEMETKAQEINHMFNLHRIILVGFRVRQLPDGEREPVLDICTPARFRIVLHPNDRSQIVGFVVKTEFHSARTLQERQAEWVLWTAHERLRLDGRFAGIESTYLEHGLGVNPWLLLTKSASTPGIWPGEEGEDLTAGHMAVWLQNILGLKESKSATKQLLLSGDLAGATRGQVSDSDVPGELPEGVAAQTVDRSMDLEMFQGQADHVMHALAANHGISASLLEHAGVQSADARELMRVPIRELRIQQLPMFRRFEKRLVAVMVAVLNRDAPDRAFNPEGHRTDFGESQTPLTKKEDLEQFETERRLGMDNTEDYMVRRNPDLTPELARAAIDHNIEVETARVGKLKALQALQGGVDESVPGARDRTGAPLRAISGGKADDGPPKE